jgi:hypothetical protein
VADFDPTCGAFPWDKALGFYEHLVGIEGIGNHWVPFRDIVASILASPHSQSLYIYPSQICPTIATFNEPDWWKKYPRVDIFRSGSFTEGQIGLRCVDMSGRQTIRECHPDEAIAVIVGFLLA